VLGLIIIFTKTGSDEAEMSTKIQAEFTKIKFNSYHHATNDGNNQTDNWMR